MQEVYDFSNNKLNLFMTLKLRSFLDIASSFVEKGGRKAVLFYKLDKIGKLKK
ncbi:hypothetical protein [Oceanobacillus neutriphilus]|nr:hypothetical protein [Oceanobacillus neutriphilus]